MKNESIETQRLGRWMRNLVCAQCGRPFIGDYRKKYCSKACSDLQEKMSASMGKEGEQRRKWEREVRKRARQGRFNGMTGDEIARRARDEGMSYGEYVAHFYGMPKVEVHSEV